MPKLNENEFTDLVEFIELISGQKLSDYKKAAMRGIYVAKIEKETD